MSDELECSPEMLADAERRVHAAGDVARWHNPRYGRTMWLENWTSAREQAAVVAHNIASPDERRVAAIVPYVWSGQLGRQVQHVGDDDLDYTITTREDGPDQDSQLFVHRRGGEVVGATGFAAPRGVLAVRRSLQAVRGAASHGA